MRRELDTLIRRAGRCGSACGGMAAIAPRVLRLPETSRVLVPAPMHLFLQDFGWSE
jgi:hypothetical protein